VSEFITNPGNAITRLTPDQWAAAEARMAAEAAEARKGHEVAERAAKAKALRDTGIPAKDQERISADIGLTATPALEALSDDAAILVCLSGNPGCGKTTAAASWIWRYLNDSANWAPDRRMLGTPAVIPARPLPLFIKAARLSRWERYDAKEMDKLLLAARLVIDDLGVEFQDSKGNFMAILDEVIDVRYDESRPTVVTTNLEADAFKLRYGERIADRIRESGRFVSLSNASLRKRT
jgi:hypothetical protein